MVKSKYVTYHSVLVVGTRHALGNTGNGDVGVQNKQGLRREVSGGQAETRRTYIKDVEDPVQFLFPTRSC